MTTTTVKTAVIALQEGYGIYNFSADITVSTEAPSFMSPSTDGSISNGIVTVGDGDNKTTVARFRSADAGNLSVDFMTADSKQRQEVQAGISAFCLSARAYIGKANISVSVEEE